MYYVYVYLDPRYKEIHTTSIATFLYRPIYVGKGTKNRYKSHLYNNKYNRLFESHMKVLRKLGRDNIPILKIFESECSDTCFEIETKLINEIGKHIDNNGPLLNLDDGGKGGSVPTTDGRRRISEANKGKIISDETRKKMSEAQKGKPVSQETREKISKSLKGNVPWNKGKTGVYSDEALEKMRNKTISDETRKKMSEAQKGKVQTEEHKRKNSEANKGRVVSDETKKKMSKSRKEYWRKKKEKENTERDL